MIDHHDQINGIKPKDQCKKYNTGSTTNAWMGRQSQAVAEEKLWTLMRENISSVHSLVSAVSRFEPGRRMVRISSDVLPLYTHETWSYFWKRTDVVDEVSRHFARVGDLARANDVRLSFHPGQFCVLASENPGIVERSIDEFEYHADMARWMGYGSKFQDLKINVHIGGRRGPAGVIDAIKRMSPEARNTITIENEENSWGLDQTLTLADHVPLVLDVHHHFVREGQYIDPDDSRVSRVIDSWRGVRPTMHLSQSREEYLVDHPLDQRPDRDQLIASGVGKQKLRAHSDYMWNHGVNQWAAEFSKNFDIMVEAKGKNLASAKFYHQYISPKEKA